MRIINFTYILFVFVLICALGAEVSSWATSGPSSAYLGRTWNHFGDMLRHVGSSWGYLETTCGLIGSTLGFINVAKWEFMILHMFHTCVQGFVFGRVLKMLIFICFRHVLNKGMGTTNFHNSKVFFLRRFY